MEYVIIGNSAAGIGAIEGIRQVDKTGKITVISDEKHHTYSRPLISYLILGKTTEQRMRYRGDNFYKDNNCELVCGKVTAIDSKKKQVTLADGKTKAFDKLLVATGSSAFVPPFAGLDGVKNKFTFMSLDDAKALQSAIGHDKKVLIVGAGLIGLKCAEGIHGKVKSITVVDFAPCILSSILDEKGAAIVQKHIEDKGVSFKLSAKVDKFEGNTAVLDSGAKIDFDIVVLAVGVRPNTQLLAGIADIGRGITINGKSETSVKGIYAAGDCTETTDISADTVKIMALLPNAYMQGEAAGVNMAGGNLSFDKAVPMNAIGFFGLHIITAGNYVGEGYVTESEKVYKKLFYKDNLLKGYILVGKVDKAGIYTSLIREKTPLDSIDFALMCENPALMAFTKAERAKKLGGVR